MKSLLWKDGRFGWPLVVAVVFTSASLLVSDYTWRLAQMPFETLLIILFAANAAAIALSSAVYLLFLRKRFIQAQASRPASPSGG